MAATASNRRSSQQNSRKNGAQAASASKRSASRSTASKSRQGSGSGAAKPRPARTTRAATNRTRAAANRTRAATQSGTRAATQSAAETVDRKQSRASGSKDSATRIIVPAATAALGVVGGVALGRAVWQEHNPELFGLRLPNVKIDFADTGKHIGDAAKQLARLVNEIQTAREKAERIGQAIAEDE